MFKLKPSAKEYKEEFFLFWIFFYQPFIELLDLKFYMTICLFYLTFFILTYFLLFYKIQYLLTVIRSKIMSIIQMNSAFWFLIILKIRLQAWIDKLFDKKIKTFLFCYFLLSLIICNIDLLTL